METSSSTSIALVASMPRTWMPHSNDAAPNTCLSRGVPRVSVWNRRSAMRCFGTIAVSSSPTVRASRWQPFPDSLTLYRHVLASPTDQGALAGCGYTTLYYVIRQALSEARTRAVLTQFCAELTVIPFTRELAATAQRLQMGDLEDACVAASALAGGCDVIASRNVQDFAVSFPNIHSTWGDYRCGNP